jgi:hypothetical protein
MDPWLATSPALYSRPQAPVSIVEHTILQAHATGYDLDGCYLASTGQAIRKPIKVRSKVTLSFAGA